MKQIFLAFNIIILSFSHVNAQDLIWARTVGSVENDYVNDIVTDHLGNIYVVGVFTDTADFDPGTGVISINTSEGAAGLFIQKFDPNGNLIWVKAIANTLSPGESFCIAVDQGQNVYVAAEGVMNCDFDPGPGIFHMPDQNGSNPFVLKLASNGDFVWAKALESTFTAQINSLKVDDTGNIYLTGTFGDSLDADLSNGTNWHITNGNDDAFVMKLDSDLVLQWSYSLGGSGGDEGTTIILHNSSVFVTGDFSGPCDFDPSQGSYILNDEGKFILKLGTDGAFKWVKGINSMSSPRFGDEMIFDQLGNIYVTGAYQGFADLDPGLGVDTASSWDGNDACVVKLDSAGNYIWGRKIISAGSYTSGFSMATDGSGGLHIVGIFENTTDFDPGPGGYVLTTPINNLWGFLLKLDTSGNFVWVHTFDGGLHIPYTITADPFNNVYSAGYFKATVDFDMSSTVQSSTSFGDGDAYLLKLSSTLNTQLHEKMDNDVILFPNPTSKTISISSHQPIKDIIIRDIVGKLVQQHTSLDTKQITLDIETTGVYLISITDQKGNIETRKVLVNR